MDVKGFTLVEVIAMLLMFALLFAIAYPAVTNYIEKSENEYYETLEETLELSVIDFSVDNQELLPKTIGEIKKVSIEEILRYSELETVTDKDGNNCDGNVIIERTKEGINGYRNTSCLICKEYKTKNIECEIK